MATRTYELTHEAAYLGLIVGLSGGFVVAVPFPLAMTLLAGERFAVPRTGVATGIAIALGCCWCSSRSASAQV